MKKYKHTVNIAAAPIVTVFDDRGKIIESVMVPIYLILILPCWLYATMFSFTHHVSRFTFHATAWLSALMPGGWRDDLHFMALAIQPTWRYAL